MSRKESNPTAEALREIEASGDRFADWASHHAALILGIIAGVLVLAAGIGLYTQFSASARDAASDALAAATSEYRQAMGADPVGGPIAEPANPEVARRTRTEYAARFEAIGKEHSGTTAGAIALLESGSLYAQLGESDEAAARFVAARDDSRGTAIEALASMRLASLAEERGDLGAAAKAFETASRVSAYPLRGAALAEAARCWALEGDSDSALTAYQRLEGEFPDQLLAPHISAMLDELRLRSSL